MRFSPPQKTTRKLVLCLQTILQLSGGKQISGARKGSLGLQFCFFSDFKRIIIPTYVCIYCMKSMKPLIQIGIGATEMNVAKQAEEA